MRRKNSQLGTRLGICSFLLFSSLQLGWDTNVITQPDVPVAPRDQDGPQLPKTPPLPVKPLVPNAVPDARAPDTGVTDTRALDTGVSDSGTSDAGVPVALRAEPSTDTSSDGVVKVESGVDSALDAASVSNEMTVGSDTETGEARNATAPVESLSASDEELTVTAKEAVSLGGVILSVAIGLFGAALLIVILVVALKRKRSDP